jgi:pyruvate/2-oxoglutarate dehydrogenase complex dihydrolipoamide dehydrogenase (E3) component
LERQAKRVANAAIDVRLNTVVTAELAASLAPDVIVAALGARPAVPPIPGIDGKNVLGAEELYYNPEKAGKRLVVLGGGLVGLELGIFMAMRGHGVTVVEMLPELALDLYGMHTMSVTLKIAELGIPVHLSTRTREITEKGVSCENAEGKIFFDADTVVYATGQRPLREESFALHGCAPEFYQLGDCVTPKNILAATKAAYTVAKDIGRI